MENKTVRTINPDLFASMIRVNQAGEYGAGRIYAGQMAILGKIPSLKTMADEEAAHLKIFNDLAIKYQVRPTVLQPLWFAAGYILGVVTAAMGEKAAHACTMAVEDVIDTHYQSQLDQLTHETAPETQELRQMIAHCHAEEVAHKEEAQRLGAAEAPFFTLLTGTIKTATRLAIWLSQRF